MFTIQEEKEMPIAELDYDWILFDADETLFRFDDLSGLKRMFSSYGIIFSETDYKTYKKINETLWMAYQNGEIIADEIRQKRFSSWSEQLGLTSRRLNSDFLIAMSEICEPLDGAINLLNALKGKAKLGIITNGFAEWQEMRLARLGLTEYIDLLVTSEQVGVAKPHRAIFNHALEKMGHPDRKRVLMVGDNPHSDILGGINAGLDTCWLNRHNQSVSLGIAPTHHVSTLLELEMLLFELD